MSLLFPIIFLFVFLLMYVYVYYRLIQRLHFGSVIKDRLKYILIITYIGVICYLVCRYFIDVNFVVYYIFSLSIGIGFILFIMALLYEVLFMSSFLVTNISRRVFFRRSIDYAVLLGGISYASASSTDAKDTVIEHISIPIARLDKEYHIVQISDVHIGGLIDKEFVISLIDKINTLSPDIVVITGDLIDAKLEHIQDTLLELKKLSSKYGVYFILGNHEYFHQPLKVIQEIQNLGITVLQNSSVIINNSFNLIGLYDRFGAKIDLLVPNLQDAQQYINKSLPSILLAHQPKYILENEIKDIDLVLCGHTHGGQIFPFSLLVKLNQKFLRGLYEYNGFFVYVNRGTGFWGPPMRLLSTAEITSIKLIPKV